MSKSRLNELMQPLPKVDGEGMGAFSKRKQAKFAQMIELTGLPPEDDAAWESPGQYWSTLAFQVVSTFCPGMQLHQQGHVNRAANTEVQNKAKLATLALLIHDGKITAATGNEHRANMSLSAFKTAKKLHRDDWDKMLADRSKCDTALYVAEVFKRFNT